MDTPGTPVSKKKAPAKVARSKGIDLLSEAALLMEAQLKKALKRSKHEISIHKSCGSSEGAYSELEVPDESKGKSLDTSEGTGLKPRVPDVSTPGSSKSKNKYWGDSSDEANEQGDDERTKSDDEPTKTDNPKTSDDEEETQDDEFEEYEMINEELYGDVNISLIDAEPADKEKDDEEMIMAGHVNVNQEGAGNQVKDVAQATQKTEGPIPSSSISSDYASKYLNFDNIHPLDTEVVSMLDINIQHEVLRTSPLLTIPVSVIPKHTIANPPKIVTTTSSTTISTLLTSLFPHLHQLTPILTPTTTEARTSTTTVSESETLAALQLRVIDLEKDVKELKDVDNSTKVILTIQSEVLKAIKEYLRSSLDDAMHKDEDAMDEGFADKLKKRKQDDVDKDEGLSVGSDRGLKRRKTSKDTEPSKKAKLTETSKGTSKSQLKSTSKSAQAEETVFEVEDTQESQNQGYDLGKTDDQPNVEDALKHDYKIAQAEKPPLSFDELRSTPINFSAYVINHLKIENLTQDHLVGPVFNLLKGICKSHVELEYNIEGCRQVVPVDYFIKNDLEYLRRGSLSKKYMTSTTKTKAGKYDIQGIEDMVPSLWSPVKVAYDRNAIWGPSHRGRNRVITYAIRNTKLLSGIEDSHHGPSDAMQNPPQPLKVSQKTLVSFLTEIVEHQSDTKVFTMTMENLPEPTSNKLCGSETLSYWLTHTVLSALRRSGNLDGGSSCNEVLKLKNFKKDVYTSFQNQEKYEHVGLKVISTQDGKRSQDDDDKRLCLVDDLKEAQVYIQVKLKGEKVKAITTMGKENVKDPVPRNLPVVQTYIPLTSFLGSRYRTPKTICAIGIPREIQEDDGDMNDACDIMIEEVERLRKILISSIHTLPDLKPIVSRNATFDPSVHITPLDGDYVAPATNPILNKHLNEFREEFADNTRVSEKIYSNLVNDLKELLNAYDFETFNWKLLHQVEVCGVILGQSLATRKHFKTRSVRYHVDGDVGMICDDGCCSRKQSWSMA
ncbi:hypothetical protein Tco_0283189 [Tanacetum coccineum]